MWSDNDIDNAFQRLNPPDPELSPFPLDAWLRLETQLDKAIIERAVRRKLWRFFAAEVAMVTLVALGWLLWPTSTTAPASTVAERTNAGKNKIFNVRQLANKTSRAAAPETVAAMAPPPALANTTASPAASNFSAPTHSSSSQATTETAQPASRAAASHPSPLLAAATPGGQREQARKRLRPAERLTEPHGLAISHATTPASRKGLRKAEKTQVNTMRNTSISTVASATADEPAPVTEHTGQAVTERSLASSKNNSAHTTSATSRKRQNNEKAHGSVSELAIIRAATTTSSTGDNSATTDGATASLSLAALTPQLVALESTAAPELPATLATVANAPGETVLPLPQPQPRFYIGLVAAPDVSTVKFAGVQSPLLSVGVTFEYRLTNRLRLSTGLLRAPKQYTARRGDYDWGAYHNLVYQHSFEYVDGNCTVLDVPLNLRFDLLARPQYRVFGSAGLSSYFMQREEYSYDWVDQNGPGTWKRYATNENHKLLGVINLSFGYERSLGTRWSLQAEPYLKVPLNGVGIGKVQLVSGGVFFGAKYGF